MTFSNLRVVVSILACVCGVILTTQAWSDQDSPELPGLFSQLLVASDESEAHRLEGLIWQEWLEAPDEQSGKLMAKISLSMGGSDLAVALQLCNELVLSHPHYAEAWNKRATVNYLLGNNAESVADIRETIAREPRHFGAISGLGFIFLRTEDLDAALSAFEQVLAISPASSGARRSVDRLRQEVERKKERELEKELEGEI